MITVKLHRCEFSSFLQIFLYPSFERKERTIKEEQIFESLKRKRKRKTKHYLSNNREFSNSPQHFPFSKENKNERRNEHDPILSSPTFGSKDPHERKQARSLLETQISRKRSSLPRGWRRRDGWKRNAGWK